MRNASSFRQQAREALSGNWPTAIITTLVAGLLGGSLFVQQTGMNIVTTSQQTMQNQDIQYNLPDGGYGTNVLLGAAVFSGSLILIISLIQFLVGGFVSLGLIQFNMNLIDKKPVDFMDIFSKSDMFVKALFLRLRLTVFTFLWTLLFIIPGIIKSYSYSMSGFIMTENPEISSKEAMEVSMKMMSGNKWRLFCLQLSFIGWYLLGALACGIGIFFVQPYVNAAIAAFYDDVSRNPIEME